MSPVLVLIVFVALHLLTSTTMFAVEVNASEPSASPPSEVTSYVHTPEDLNQTKNKPESEHKRIGKVMEEAGLRDKELRSTQPQRHDATDEKVVQSMHNASAAPQEKDISEGDTSSSKGTTSDEVDEDLLNLGLIQVTTSAHNSYSSTTETDVEGSGMEEDEHTQAYPGSSEKPDDRAPPFTGCTLSLCQDILRANITAEPSFAKVVGGEPVKFTCKQTSDFNETGRWFILRWQGPNGTLGPLQEKHEGQRGRASVLSGRAVSDIRETNYMCVPDVPSSCCDDVGVTVTLVVYDLPVYTTHMAVLGGLVLLLALLCLALHETRRRMYQRVNTEDDADEEWEYDK